MCKQHKLTQKRTKCVVESPSVSLLCYKCLSKASMKPISLLTFFQLLELSRKYKKKAFKNNCLWVNYDVNRLMKHLRKHKKVLIFIFMKSIWYLCCQLKLKWLLLITITLSQNENDKNNLLIAHSINDCFCVLFSCIRRVNTWLLVSWSNTLWEIRVFKLEIVSCEIPHLLFRQSGTRFTLLNWIEFWFRHIIYIRRVQTMIIHFFQSINIQIK